MTGPRAAAPLLVVGDAVWQHAAAQGLQVAAPPVAAGLVWRAAARSPAAERGPWRVLAAALLLYSEVHPVGLVRLAGTVLAGAAPFLALRLAIQELEAGR